MKGRNVDFCTHVTLRCRDGDATERPGPGVFQGTPGPVMAALLRPTVR